MMSTCIGCASSTCRFTSDAGTGTRVGPGTCSRFACEIPTAHGALRYEGNWRDVFQNWEALALSFPGYLPGMVAKFVNASTVDGFNPFRIAHDGVDWERLDPQNPWSGIGYWGDHQIVYLLRFLESMRCHHPGGLEALLVQQIFSYADVPYRIKPYPDLLANPRATIVFDEEREAAVRLRVAEEGLDGKLLHTTDDRVYHVSLLEKLIVPALAKLSNFVPDGGIWMNTERPEWNDANNALAGSGLSVVTLCYLRRYLRFLEDMLAGVSPLEVPVSVEVVTWMRQVADALARHHAILDAERVSDGDRKRLLDELGTAFSAYRAQVYANGFSTKSMLGSDEVLAWCRSALEHVDHAIRANRRDDGLYHAYNLLDLGTDDSRAAVRRLGIMLEGQVAALSSGLVSAREANDMVDNLFTSPLYRSDQNSFMLYPDKSLPSFLERNRIPEAKANQIPLLGALMAAGDRSIVERDAEGTLRFHADFSSSRDVAAALDLLERSGPCSHAVASDRQITIDLFEDVFGHRTFTGRSGTMYAYEGLGSVYWHMVAKLLLAVQELALSAFEREAPEVRDALARHYYRIRSGLGFEKSVQDFGAFPSDPYSHTPAGAGAQQPGMTGQVKEEILTRFGELGVRVCDGVVEFAPVLLKREEFLSAADTMRWFDLAGHAKAIDIAAGELAFTYCQVPVVYVLTLAESWIRVSTADNIAVERAGCRLSPHESHTLFDRLGGITRIDVGLPERALFGG